MKKMTFGNINDVLSRNDMRQIMAGSNNDGKTCSVKCTENANSQDINNCERQTVIDKCGSADNATCTCWG